QAVPGQMAIKRGIYLSGIHTQQQPQQSAGVMEQHKDTQPGHGSPRRANLTLTAPKPSASSKSSVSGAVVDASGSGKPHSQKLASANVRHSPDQGSVTIDSPAANAATSQSRSRSVGSGG